MDGTRIAIVCSNDLVREGLRAVLEARQLSVSRLAASVADLVGEAKINEAINVVLVASPPEQLRSDDVQMIKERLPTARVALTIDHHSIDYVAEALEKGVDGVLTDDMSCDQIVVSLRLIALGERVVSSRVLQQLLENQSLRVAVNEAMIGVDLSARELEILKCLVAGEANKIISRRLGITEATVKVHVKAILRKLNVTNRTQAAIWAVVRGVNRLEVVSGSQTH